ncbi:MAG TPA: tripartite tricarboxylate transporter substrate-binding protein [Xanthobacteraceae bacterium]|jgi:tripartite-type tricarboxylate transporter receptor subunit TctC|nr:tripartite tricarboxylate transporter substrate-binding protein [Xanthobacteraceae bacterium]
MRLVRLLRRVQTAFCIGLCAGFSVVLLAGPPASAESVESFYKGRTITMLVGQAPGGINDISARLVAKHLGHYIPGNPSIIVQNNPGAGGLITANRIYNTAEKDGSVIAKLERAVPQLAIQGEANASFDPTKFTWLGSLSSYADDGYLLLVNAGHPAKSVFDLKKPGTSVSLGADNKASSNLIFAIIARDALGLNIKIVRGYAGAAPMFLAMQRGELDGQMVGLSSVKTGQRDLWNKKAFRPLLAFGRTTRLSEFPDVPTGRELTKDPSVLALIEFAELPFFMALPFVAPPGIPADRAEALQSAFMQMCKDKDFVAEAEKLGIDMSPIDGKAILALLARTAATPKEVIARYNHLVAQ